MNVRGKGDVGQIVTVSDGDSNTLLGVVSVNTSGKWKFIQKNPSPIPRRLKAISENQVVFSDVANVPVMA